MINWVGCSCVDVDGKLLNLCGSDLCQLLRSGHLYGAKVFVTVDDEEEQDEE